MLQTKRRAGLRVALTFLEVLRWSLDSGQIVDQGPAEAHGHVGLVDPEAERGAYTIEMRSLWGFDAQVASGKLRECAGCAPQGDTQIDTLDRQW